MANNSKQCFNTHYQSHCHPTTKSLWLCSSVYCRPPHKSRRIWLVAAATNQKGLFCNMLVWSALLKYSKDEDNCLYHIKNMSTPGLGQVREIVLRYRYGYRIFQKYHGTGTGTLIKYSGTGTLYAGVTKIWTVISCFHLLIYFCHLWNRTAKPKTSIIPNIAITYYIFIYHFILITYFWNILPHPKLTLFNGNFKGNI